MAVVRFMPGGSQVCCEPRWAKGYLSILKEEPTSPEAGAWGCHNRQLRADSTVDAAIDARG